MSISFETLWDKFPDDAVAHIDRKAGKDTFDNHCAINLSEAFRRAGVSVGSFHGTRCWSCPTGGRAHILRAQEMANWLKIQRPVQAMGATETCSGRSFVEKLDGRTGIIFLKDYWRRGATEATRTGDHIDLWNGSRMTSVLSYFRAQFGFSWEGLFTDYSLAKEVWFWPIK